MSNSSNADNCLVFNNFGSKQEINLFGEENDFKKELIEEEKDFKKEFIEVLKEISKRLYHIEVEIANKII